MSNPPLRRPVRRYIADKISILVLLSVGLLGASVGILDTVGELEKLLSYLPFLHHLKNTSSLVLVIVSLLAIAAGAERYASFEEIREALQKVQSEAENGWQKIDSDLQEIHQILAAKIPINIFWKREKLYQDIFRALNRCKGAEIIRSTALMRHSGEGSAEHADYLKTLARKIKGSGQDTLRMLCRVVVNSQAESFESSIDKRRAVFASEGVEDRLDIRESRDLWSLDVLIIGADHLYIGFPTQKAKHTLRLGIRINERELVETFIRWYDECVWETANPVVMSKNVGTSTPEK